jgi:hypothetical protein
MTLTVTTRKGTTKDGETVVTEVPEREDALSPALYSELSFINSKLERAGHLPDQLTQRKAELEEILGVREAEEEADAELFE